jgi:hypothetical protein
MDNYVLIKKYPGSPKLGTIVDKRGNFVYFDINSPNMHNTISENYVENYPEYWEKVNYKILSYYNHNIPHIIFMLNANGKYMYRNQELSEKHGCYIHSIKRLSDGEIFTIGDKVQDSLTDKLTNFKIQNITFFYSGSKIICQAESGTTMPLNTIRHCNVLFRTEDGVNIFEGNIYCAVFYNFKYLEQEAIENYKLDNAHWRFSTKDKAEQFITMNKPCLSVNDVMNAGYGICNPLSLINIVKEKL